MINSNYDKLLYNDAREQREYAGNAISEIDARFTKEELSMYLGCAKDAMTKMGIPTGSMCALATYTLLKFTRSRINTLPVIFASSCIGYVAGVTYYRMNCLNKVINLPGSNLKARIEAAAQQKLFKLPVQDEQNLSSIGTELSDTEIQYPRISNSDMDNYQPSNNFDGYSNLNVDNVYQDEQLNDYYNMEPIKKVPGIKTYDDLRQKNRNEYVKSYTNRSSLNSFKPAGNSDKRDLTFEENRGYFNHDAKKDFKFESN